MANIASSKKDARRSAERAVRNRSIRSSVKTKVTKVRRALAEGATEDVPELADSAVSGLDRAAAKGVLHRNNAARRKSRLMKRVQAAGVEAATPAAPVKGGAKSAAKPAAKSTAKSTAKPAAKAAAKPAAKAKAAPKKTAKK